MKEDKKTLEKLVWDLEDMSGAACCSYHMDVAKKAAEVIRRIDAEQVEQQGRGG